MPTFIAPTDISLGATGAWTDIDVSASVPAGATGVIVHVVNTNATTSFAVGLRKNGSTDNRTTNMRQDSHFWIAIGVDGSRILEGYIGNTAVDFFLVGYFTSDAVFLTNAADKSLATTNAWTDIDVSADTGADTATGVFMELIHASGSTSATGLRKNGSTDDRKPGFNNHSGAAIGVDGSELFEGYIGITNVDFFLVGYTTSNATWNTNATDLSLGSTGAWTDLSALPTGAIGGVFELAESTGTVDRKFGLRKNGTTEDIVRRLQGARGDAIVEADASQIVEGQINNTNVDFYLVGYFTSASGTTFTYTGSGGLTSGGTAAVTLTKNYIGSGGLTTGGSAGVTLTKDYIASGGLTTGGSASVAVTKDYTASGGFTSGGTAGVTLTKDYTASGGLTSGGTAGVAVTKDYIASGGLTTGGTATTAFVRTIYPYTASGGLTATGNASTKRVGAGGFVVVGHMGFREDPRHTTPQPPQPCTYTVVSTIPFHFGGRALSTVVLAPPSAPEKPRLLTQEVIPLLTQEVIPTPLTFAYDAHLRLVLSWHSHVSFKKSVFRSRETQEYEDLALLGLL